MIYIAQGNALVTAEEFDNALKYDNLPAFYSDFSKGLKPKAIKFPTGELSVENIHTGVVAVSGSPPIPFKPIGPGKPLTVQIREVYAGK